MKPIFELTPRQIVKELDEYIIGQDDAKRAVAIALRNRWRRRRIEDEIRNEIIPNNILMIGSTGVGKTEIARRLARLAGAPFVKVEASKFTEVGYVGRDVEGIIRDLVESAVAMVRSEKTGEVEEEARERVEEKLLDILLPPPQEQKKSGKSASNPLEQLFSMQGDDEEDEDEDVEEVVDPTVEQRLREREQRQQERYMRSRAKMRERLASGDLDDREVEIKLPERSQGGMMQVFGPAGIEEMGINLQEMFGGMFPKKSKKRRVSVGEARNILLGEEVDRLIDMDAVIGEALSRTEETGIVFLDEIDKIAAPNEAGSGPDVSREGVQRDILPIVEGSRVSTKYGIVSTEHILFIAAGAFHTSKPSDLIPELQGRFPIRVELDNLDRKDFVRILTKPRNALVKQFQALLKAEGVELKFEPAALRELAAIAEELNELTENIGARRLQTVLNALLDDVMFRIPTRTIKNVTVTRKQVRERLTDMLEDEDLSRYIL
ncbi:ATP-dependent protease ATPase subunit HslU [bacterium]|nr:ATP-dependent protease ATPase subunit HslU [bacterium]